MCKKKNTNSFILLVLGIIIALLFVACSSDENNPTESTIEADLIGVWKQISMSWTTSYECGCYSQSQLDSLGLVWELTFNSDKSAEQLTNLDDSLTTQTGTWTLSGNVLSLTLKAPTTEEVGTIDYTCVLENNLLNLCWTIPTGTEFSSEFTKK